MASPHAAGVAVLVLSSHPEFDLKRLRAAVLFGGEPKPSLEQTTITGRRLSASGSLQNATQPDSAPPANISDLHISGQTGRHISLAWTAPGDDGNVGTASLYEVRFIDQTTGEKFRLDSIRPNQAGTPEFSNIQLPYRHTAGTITLTTTDKAGNASSASINVSVAPESGDPYIVTEGPAEALSTGGTPLHASTDDATFGYNLPFSFPFFEHYRAGVSVSTNGVLYFFPPSSPTLDPISSRSVVPAFSMIAGLWDDLDLSTSWRPDGEIYVVKPDANRIIFRWRALRVMPMISPDDAPAARR